MVLAGFMFFNSQAQERPVITVDEIIAKSAASDTTFIILDVRTPEELKGPLGKIDGVINIPLQELEARLPELKPYKGKEIAVICRSGNRSRYATDILNKKGFDARNVPGGMIEYRKSLQK